MASIQERLQIKRVPIDKWSIKEQLCLASAVGRSGDQNWMSVSRALKTFGDPNRPADWFSQKNCAAQYGSLLENVETPKRKKRTSSAGSEVPAVETPGESILRKLTQERIQELKNILESERKDYLKLKEEIDCLEANRATDAQIEEWHRQSEEEEKQKEKDAIDHSVWLKEREQRKQEVERAWRPFIKLPGPALSGAAAAAHNKRKASEAALDASGSDLDTSMTAGGASDSTTAAEASSSTDIKSHESPTKPALSPLLTSLLKSPSQASLSGGTSSILHSVITSSTNRPSPPSIASLLKTNPNNGSSGVSPQLAQLVTTAISQEPQVSHQIPLLSATTVSSSTETTQPTVIGGAESILELPTKGSFRVAKSDAASVSDDVKSVSENSESVLEKSPGNNDDVLSETTVDELNLPTPASELNLPSECGDEDVNTELQTPDILDSTGGGSSVEAAESSSGTPVVDDTKSKDSDSTYVENDEASSDSSAAVAIEHSKKDESISKKEVGGAVAAQSGSVEIVEVMMEDEDSDKELNSLNEISAASVHVRESPDKGGIGGDEKSAASSTPSSQKPSDAATTSDDLGSEKSPDTPLIGGTTVSEDSKDAKDVASASASTIDIDLTLEPAAGVGRRSTFSPSEYNESTFFDDVPIEVKKLDKSGRAKRDYSRTTKRREEKDIDILLAMENARAFKRGLEDSDLMEETSSEKDFGETSSHAELLSKKSDVKKMIKLESERSNSPWTEEEDISSVRTRRRYSTPATPIDSVPNSPASSITTFGGSAEDERDYRNWKKAIMLIHNSLSLHKYTYLFTKPITDDQAPNYHNLVYRPMDLQTIRKNIEAGVIRTTAEFRRDVLLMFSNAIMYNKTNSQVHKMAKIMQKESLQQLAVFMQAQKEGEAPVRRETRTSEPGLKRKRQEDSPATSSSTAGGARSKKRREDLIT